MSQRARRIRVIIAWALLAGVAICWPLSLILHWDPLSIAVVLSWLAIVIECGSFLTSSQVHEEQGKDDR